MLSGCPIANVTFKLYDHMAGLPKKFPSIKWDKFNVTVIAGGMGAFSSGYNCQSLP
ncbi:hypothetical protein BGZ58_008853 [Dissophora ornata]|nr:hypothetical protein BGZ58_008853 [Dissophora ornata]